MLSLRNTRKSLIKNPNPLSNVSAAIPSWMELLEWLERTIIADE